MLFCLILVLKCIDLALNGYVVPDNLDGEKNTIPYYLISENNKG